MLPALQHLTTAADVVLTHSATGLPEFVVADRSQQRGQVRGRVEVDDVR